MSEISVVIPTFRPRDLAALERCIAANADVDSEWIVVDDGSGAEYDSVFAGLPDGVRLVRLPQNCRQGAARNSGLARAQGEWIKFLDADDELDAGHLAALQEATRSVLENKIPFAPTRHVFADGRMADNNSWRGLDVSPETQLARPLHEITERLGGPGSTLSDAKFIPPALAMATAIFSTACPGRAARGYSKRTSTCSATVSDGRESTAPIMTGSAAFRLASFRVPELG